jgi:ABC-2 type transport system permease protein
MDSTQGFHAVMSVFLMPMWLLSGAFFPAAGGWLGAVIAANPLTYGVAGLRRLLYLHSSAASAEAMSHLPSLGVCWLVTVIFAVVTFVASCRIAATRTTGDLL